MAKKKEINYFTELNSNEDLDNFTAKHKGLLVLDVYQEQFGPCSASLHSTLQKAKISLTDSDKLQLAVCNANKVDKMKRFLSKCQPTMLFCSHGRVVDIVYGANIPQLSQTIQTQLRLEEQHVNGELERTFYEFDEPLPFERDEIDRKKATEEEATRMANEQIEMERQRELDEVIDKTAESAPNMGVTLFMPHVATEALRKTQEAAKSLSISSRDRTIIQLRPELMETLNYKLENPIDEAVLERIFGQDLLAMLWIVDGDRNTEQVLAEFVNGISGRLPTTDADGNRISGILQPSILNSEIIYLDGNEDEDVKSTTKSTSLLNQEAADGNVDQTPAAEVDSIADDKRSKGSRNSQRQADEINEVEVTDDNDNGDDDGRPKLIIPPAWTPANQSGNALLKSMFFRKEFEYFLGPAVEPEPPHLCMIFPAANRHEIFEICKDYPEKDLLAFGYFTAEGDEFDEHKLICKTTEKFESLPIDGDERIIMKVAKRTSHMVLALTLAGPLYMSMNEKEGAKECAVIFDQQFQAANDVQEAEEMHEGEQEIDES